MCVSTKCIRGVHNAVIIVRITEPSRRAPQTHRFTDVFMSRRSVRLLLVCINAFPVLSGSAMFMIQFSPLNSSIYIRIINKFARHIAFQKSYNIQTHRHPHTAITIHARASFACISFSAHSVT